MAESVVQGQVTEQDVELLTTANTVEFDEAGLADASIAGSTEAFESLYTHYFPKVRGFCLRKLGNSDLAEDIAQEAFARAFERINDFGGPRHFGGWVGTIAANLCTDHLRRKKNQPVPLDDPDTGPSYEVDPIRNLQREDTGRLVRLALDRLEPRHREALVLHEVRGMSCAAVGQRLGITEVAAESLLARARRRRRREITAKAAPADLFGLGGLGLLPALVRAWRRAREGVSRRTASVHAAAARSWETVSGSLVPSLDTAKALVVVVGVALAAEAAGVGGHGNATPAEGTSTPLAAASIVRPMPVDGDLGAVGRGPEVPVAAMADVDPAGQAAKVGIDTDSRKAAQDAPALITHFYFETNPDFTVLDARVAAGGDGAGSYLLDTGTVHEEYASQK